MNKQQLISGFSKLSKQDKISIIADLVGDSDELKKEFAQYWHEDTKLQKRFDEFSENTLTNYYMPFGIAPNLLINGKLIHAPMVIEESSVVAAASNSAKFWATRGGFRAKVISNTKIGQVHFIWKGELSKLKYHFPELKKRLIRRTAQITANMRQRGGGILDIELVNMADKIPDYYQLKASFDTVDSMGANFINSCLEEFAMELKDFMLQNESFSGHERDVNVIMSILSNYTPDCLVECSVSAPVSAFEDADPDLTASEFVWKFKQAVEIAKVDPHRATTHNKGIFNGIDSIALATGNDFRAIEACGHTYASRNGQYTSLTDVKIENDVFTYTLTIPLAMGTVGGLTSLHPLARRSLEILGNPNAEELMMIAAAAGLANNFSAIKSLITKGIQVGHMKMHLLNILNHFGAKLAEKNKAVAYFKDHKVSFNAVEEFLMSLREREVPNAC